MAKYPNVKIELIGQDGNAFSIMGRAIAAARRAGVPQEEIRQYKQQAMSGDYDNLLVTTMEWFNCDGEEEDSDEETWDDDDDES